MRIVIIYLLFFVSVLFPTVTATYCEIKIYTVAFQDREGNAISWKYNEGWKAENVVLEYLLFEFGVEIGDTGKTQFNAIRLDSIYRCIVNLLCRRGYSFNTAFTNCESVKCIIIGLINTL